MRPTAVRIGGFLVGAPLSARQPTLHRALAVTEGDPQIIGADKHLFKDLTDHRFVAFDANISTLVKIAAGFGHGSSTPATNPMRIRGFLVALVILFNVRKSLNNIV